MNTIPQHLRGRYAVVLFRSKGIVSTLIAWQTRGNVSHAGILLPSGCVIESMQGVGVRTISPAQVDWSLVEAYEVIGMTDDGWDRARLWGMGQMGAGYDYWAIIRFISRHRMPDNDRWFCSEFAFQFVKEGGIELLARIAAWAVDPMRLKTSPLLRLITS